MIWKTPRKLPNQDHLSKWLRGEKRKETKRKNRNRREGKGRGKRKEAKGRGRKRRHSEYKRTNDVLKA